MDRHNPPIADRLKKALSKGLNNQTAKRWQDECFAQVEWQFWFHYGPYSPIVEEVPHVAGRPPQQLTLLGPISC